MKKFFTLLFLAGIGLFLIDFQSPSLTANDVFVALQDEERPPKLENFIPTPRGFFIEKKNAVIGTEALLSKIDKAPERIILIGLNEGLNGRYKVAVPVVEDQGNFEWMPIDSDFIDQVLAFNEIDLSVGKSLGAFSGDLAINQISETLWRKGWTETEIVPIVLNKFASVEDVSTFASYLYELSDENTLLIAVGGFSELDHQLSATFHNEMTKSVFSSFDFDAINKLEIEGQPLAALTLKYFDLWGARAVSFEDSMGLISFKKTGSEKIEARNLTIMAFGDMMLGRAVRSQMNKYGNDYIFEKIAGPEGRFFRGSDVVFGNLEGPIKGEGTHGGTAMVFSFNEDVAPLLKKYGFTLLSISNNHAVDQGWEGRDTTIAALNSSKLGWCGHPRDADPNSVYYSTVGDKKFAFLCFQDITFTLDDNAAVELIKEVRPNVDFLVVSVHWGYEYKHVPNDNLQINPGRAFIDAGADFIIGHHPHVVQSFEIYNGKPIFYSLGNFVFDQYWSKETQEELGIGIVLDDDFDGCSMKTKVYLFPMKSERSQSRLMTDEEYNEWIERFIGYGSYDEVMKSQIRAGVIEVCKPLS